MTERSEAEPFVVEVEIEELEPRAASNIGGSLTTKDVVHFGLVCTFFCS